VESSLLVFVQILHVLAEEVRRPVDKVEEGKHERKEDTRDDIDALRASGKLGQPTLAPVPLRQRNVNFAGAHLLSVVAELTMANEGSLMTGEKRERKRKDEIR